MRTIERPKPFRQDLKRELKGRHKKILDRGGELETVILHLANDVPLDASYRDHPLHHNWEGSRECHIKPDFLLIYTLEGEDLLILERLGSHSEILGL